MNEWRTEEWMNEWVMERMNGPMICRINPGTIEWMIKRKMKERMNECSNELMNERLNEKNEWISECINEGMKEWTNK